MEEKILVVKDKVGLHARTASVFAKKAMEFKSEIKVIFNNREVNGKSMLNIMSLGVKQGMEIKIRVNGEDELQTVNSLIQLVENNFEIK